MSPPQPTPDQTLAAGRTPIGVLMTYGRGGNEDMVWGWPWRKEFSGVSEHHQTHLHSPSSSVSPW